MGTIINYLMLVRTNQVNTKNIFRKYLALANVWQGLAVINQQSFLSNENVRHDAILHVSSLFIFT
jgi:hypothetical protein